MQPGPATTPVLLPGSPAADAGLVSSSLDSTLRVLDLERGVLAATVGVHRKGVRSFAHSPAFSLVARWAERAWRCGGLAGDGSIPTCAEHPRSSHSRGRTAEASLKPATEPHCARWLLR